MKKKALQIPDDRLLEMQKHMVRQNEIMQELMDKDPSMSFVTALVMSGDMEWAERVDAEFQAGSITFEHAVVMIGSFARFDWIVKQLDAGKITFKKFAGILPDEWRSADPDDTNPHYLELWEKARQLRGGIVTDGEDFHVKDDVVIFRGQDRHNQTIGFSWTLDVNIAIKFAKGAGVRRSDLDGLVLRGVVSPTDVLAYLTGRGEDEVIVHPSRVFVTRKYELEDL